MIELPRAALMADEIAQSAEFFSFGTNDLTQTTFGISRDDAASFLGIYTQRGILPGDPFVSIDQEGVGALVRIGVERGRKVRSKLKVGICGEHGGDPASVALLPRGRPRLCVVLAVPRADRAARRRAGRARQEGRGRGVTAFAIRSCRHTRQTGCHYRLSRPAGSADGDVATNRPRLRS